MKSSLWSGSDRYHHRGIDDEGHVANYVETEMLVLREDKEIVAAHTQIRGSIPAFWQQEGSNEQLLMLGVILLCRYYETGHH